MKRYLCPLALTATLLLGACGGDESSNENGAGQAGASSTTSSGGVANTSDDYPTTGSGTGAKSASTSPGTTPGSTPTTNASPTTGAPPASAPTDVVLKEFSVEAKTSIKAGTVTFNIANNGQFKHEFVVIKGAYETLPQSTVGAVLEKDLPSGALIGRTDTINPGSSAVFSTDLTAGPYTLLCNIASGPNSHAGKGQRLNITIS